MDLSTLVQRFEQQLVAFEKLHTDELRGLEEKLAAYRQLHADEVKLLREELAALKQELSVWKEAESTAPTAASQSQTHPPGNLAAEPQATLLTRCGFLNGGVSHREI